jgi:hypothetical protein
LFARYNTLLGSVGSCEEVMVVVPPEGQTSTVNVCVRDVSDVPEIPSVEISTPEMFATEDENDVAFSFRIVFMLETAVVVYTDVNAVVTKVARFSPVAVASNVFTYICESTCADSAPVAADTAVTEKVTGKPL